MTKWDAVDHGVWERYEAGFGDCTVRWETVNGVQAWFLRNDAETVITWLRGFNANHHAAPLATADAVLAVLQAVRQTNALAVIGEVHFGQPTDLANVHNGPVSDVPS